tara:strand:- start:208 stop:723 length:516 start_codon:yes stop_codon:yes gene_type:complete
MHCSQAVIPLESIMKEIGMSAQNRFESLVDEKAPLGKPAGLYQPCVVVGGLVYVSGHLPVQPDGSFILGCLGKELDVEAGKNAARRAGLASLVTLEHCLGSLDKVSRVVKLLGMVSATHSFTQHPAVINGCSELYAEIWGAENGVGVRSAVGVSSLPAGVAVEIEAVFELL